MTHALQNWFEWLLAAQARTLQLNAGTDPDVVAFSKQSPADLLPTQQTQRNLAQALADQFGIAPPDEAFITATFRDFVDARGRDLLLKAGPSWVVLLPSAGSLSTS